MIYKYIHIAKTFIRPMIIKEMHIITLTDIQEAPLWASLLCSIGVGISVYLYYQNKNIFSYWEKRCVKGPKPWPVFGNLIQRFSGDRMEHRWAREYGKLYGIYQGNKPKLVVADAEVLQQICIRDFDVFPNHDFNEFFNDYQKSFLLSLQDDKWKRTRALMSPTFTSCKIRRMYRFLDVCADDLIRCFQEQIEKKPEVNLKEIYSLYTMDTIATCCYGLKLDRVAGSADLKTAAVKNKFVRLALKMFDFSVTRFILLVCLPNPLLRWLGFNIIPNDKFDKLANIMRQLIGQRRTKSKEQKYDDYLQLLIDAKLDDEIELDEMDLKENHHAGLTHESLRQDQKKLTSEINLPAENEPQQLKQQVLSELEIVSGAMFLLLVGLETTSSLLAMCTYLLAYNPEVQERLHKEIEKIAKLKDNSGETSFTYESLTSCQYLDSVLAESLRISNPVSVTDRVSKRDYYIEKYKLHLPANSHIVAGFHAIMNDPDYWSEPEKFDPERFMPGNKEKIVPGSYCPFGIGPRHCIGMRFSLTEAKLALAKTIMKFRFEPAPGTSYPPKLKLNFGLINMKKPNVVMIRRD